MIEIEVLCVEIEECKTRIKMELDVLRQQIKVIRKRNMELHEVIEGMK